MMVPLLGASSKESLSHLREQYREFSEEFDGARDAHDLSLTMFDSLTPTARILAQRLAGLMLEAREVLRSLNVRQDIAKSDLSKLH